MYLISLHKSIFSSLLKDLLLLYVYLWAPASLVPPDARFRHWILRLGLDSCEPPCGCWSPNLDPLYEQQPFLTAEPSCHFLSPHKKVENTKVGNEARGVCTSANELVFSVREDGFYLAPSRWDLSRYKVNSWLPRNNAYSHFTSKFNRKPICVKTSIISDMENQSPLFRKQNVLFETCHCQMFYPRFHSGLWIGSELKEN